MSEITTEVLIVGAGPTGLMLACDLRRRKVPFRIVDRAETPSMYSRAVALQARTLEIFDDLGIVEAFLEKGVAVKAVRSYNQGRLHDTLDLDTTIRPKASYPSLLVVEQHVTENILIRELSRRRVAVDRGIELKKLVDEPDQVQCWLRTSGEDWHVRSSYVVGCDGSHSCVRRLRKIRLSGGNSELIYHVADVDLTWDMPPLDIVWLVHGETEVVAVPLPGERRYRLNLWTSSSSHREEASFGAWESARDLAFWQNTLQRLSPCDVAVSNPRSMMAYRTGHGLAETFQMGRTFLAGDAAHVMPQCTAQGLNMGIQDAYNLGWKLGLVVNGDAPRELLESYQQERRPVALKALSSVCLESTLIGRASHFESREALDEWAQMHQCYRHATRGPRSLRGESVQPGDRAPDGELVHEGATLTLYSLLTGLWHHLLIFSDFEDAELEDLLLDLKARQYPALRIHQIGLASTALLDKDSRLHRTYAAGHGDLILVRPDRFIAARAKVADTEELFSYLSEHLAPKAPGDLESAAQTHDASGLCSVSARSCQAAQSESANRHTGDQCSL